MSCMQNKIIYSGLPVMLSKLLNQQIYRLKATLKWLDSTEKDEGIVGHFESFQEAKVPCLGLQLNS